MALIDEVVIRIQGGSGGNGCISFRRETFVPFGGPNGGDGGKGGDVYLKATRDKTSLLDFKYQPRYLAERGEHGLGKDMFGRGGEDLIVAVPMGTLVFDNQTGELLADLTEHEQTILVAKGGRGGRGNLSFKSSTNRAPRNATPGELGESKELKLELKLLADVGLIGLPNAGKSSFLTAVSRARPKVADYPFTTLEPALGVVEHKGHAFVIADLPGLIERASEGAGLGHRFLRHVARNRVLLHLVDITQSPESIQKSIETIRNELGAYDPELLEREQRLVFTKIDLLPAEDLAEKKRTLQSLGLDGYFISSAAREGLGPLLDDLAGLTRRETKA
jgi:GTP-binding protein